jgi:hypothetical protein
LKIFNRVKRAAGDTTSTGNLVDASLTAGQIVEVKSHYGTSPTDTAGAARYKIVTAAEYGGTPDEYGDHTLANGNVALLQIDGPVKVSYYGIDGATNPAERLNALLVNLPTTGQNTVVFTDGVTYDLEATVTVEIPVRLDFNGATLTKQASNFEMISCLNVGAGEVELINGTIDGQNITQTFQHLVRFNDSTADLLLTNMVIKNNLQESTGTPVQSIDSDGVYVLNARRLKVENCKISNVSRNGISVIDSCDIQIYRDNEFFDCYLYGVDAEPNNEADIIYNHITFDNNDFIRCGPKGAGDYVWDYGGGAQVLSRNSVQIAQQVVVVNNRVDMTGAIKTNGDPVDGVRVDDTVTTQYANNEFKNCDVLVNAGSRTTGESATFTGNSFVDSALQVFRIKRIEGDANPMSGSKSKLVLDSFAAGDENIIIWDGSMQNAGNSNDTVLANFASSNGKVKLSVSDTRITDLPPSVVKHKGSVEFDLKCFGEFPLVVNPGDVAGIKFKGGEIDGAINFIGDTSTRLDFLDIDGLKARLTGHFIQALTGGNSSSVIIKGNDYDGDEFYLEQAASSLTAIRDNTIKNASIRSITSFSTDSAIGGNYSFNSAAYSIIAGSDIGDNIAK